MWRRVHLVLAGGWLALVVPTLLWWRDSILWLALMSIYGLVAHHLTGWETARTEEELTTSPHKPGR